MKQVPGGVNGERLLFLFNSLIDRNEKVADCSVDSLINCVSLCASLGVYPIKGTAAIVPYGSEATLLIEYRGLIELAKRNGEVAAVHTEVVRKNDLFQRTEHGVTHRWEPFQLERDRGSVVGAWCLLKLKNGEEQWETMSVEQLEHVRGKSKNQDGGPWKNDTEQMYRKTVLRRAMNYVSFSSEFTKHLATADERESVTIDADVIDVRPGVEGFKETLKQRETPAEAPKTRRRRSTPPASDGPEYQPPTEKARNDPKRQTLLGEAHRQTGL